LTTKLALDQNGANFVGFGALALVFLLLCLYTLHPELSAVEQVQHYWYQYIWCVCLLRFSGRGGHVYAKERSHASAKPLNKVDQSFRLATHIKDKAASAP